MLCLFASVHLVEYGRGVYDDRMIRLMGGIRGRMRSILSSSVIPAPEAHVSLLLLLRALLHPMRFKCARRYIEAFPPLRFQLSVSSALERSLLH